jgi:hypothetical protein
MTARPYTGPEKPLTAMRTEVVVQLIIHPGWISVAEEQSNARHQDQLVSACATFIGQRLGDSSRGNSFAIIGSSPRVVEKPSRSKIK